jgi:hypothetical protein
VKVYSPLNVARALAKARNKPVLFLAFNPEHAKFNDDWNKAVPYLDIEGEDVMQALFDGHMIIECDSDKERDKLYALTVGDDGPTMFNKYNGPVRVYALTIDRRGQTLNENT